MSDNDETTFVRTLSSDEFPREPVELSFDWRIALSESVRTDIQRKVVDALRAANLGGTPSFVTVTARRLSLGEATVRADVRDASGRRLCVLSIADNGRGAAVPDLSDGAHPDPGTR